MVTPSTSALSVIRTTSGATGSLTNEAMSELNLTTLGYPRYSVYQVTDTAKRYLARSAVPTFQYDAAGGTTWITLTPAEIQYAGGVIILSTPLTSAAAVRCASATYYTTITDLLGGSVARINNGPTLVETPLLGDAYLRRYPTIKDFSVTLDTFMVKSCASYTSSFTGTNNDIVFEHSAGGTAGNSYSIQLTDPGTKSATLSVSVTGTAVTVSLGTNTVPAINSTAKQVIDIINQNTSCRFINFTARNATGNNGTGVVEAINPHQDLTGGLNVTDHTLKFSIPLIIEIYFSTSADSRLEGYCYLESIDGNFDPKDVVKENLSFKGSGPLYYRTS